MTIYLYLKTHNKTGMKYLGKTENSDPHKYKGSGVYWLQHLKKHGDDYSTEILFKSDKIEEIIEQGIYYSDLWDIVESKEFANLQKETGDGVSSEFATKENLRRLEEGIHPFCDPYFNKKTKEKRNKTIKERKNHNFLGGEIQRKRVKDGTHHLLGGEIQRKRVKDGTHHLLGGEIQRKTQRKRVKDGTHHLLNNVIVVDVNGKTFLISRSEYENRNDVFHIHSTQGKMILGRNTNLTEKQKISYAKRIKCPYCEKIGNISNMKRWHFDNCKQK